MYHLVGLSRSCCLVVLVRQRFKL
uniref:Uncharacterized protein n=1 Tax=Rhizophora mucronata TaxID=61149 RepID=A0A2P2PTH9_RHIMU